MPNNATLEINEEAWINYRQQLYFFIVKRVSDHFVAEDITQEVLIRVYTRLETLHAHEKFLPWLYQIARNAIADYYRRSPHEAEFPDVMATFEAEDSPSVYEQLTPCLLPLIQQLPPSYQTAIRYSEIENMTQKAVAEKIGISLPGTKSRVRRGRKLLKELFFQCCQVQLDPSGKLLDFQSKSSCNPCQQNSNYVYRQNK